MLEPARAIIPALVILALTSCNDDEDAAATAARAPIVVVSAAPADAAERAAHDDALGELARYLEALTGHAPAIVLDADAAADVDLDDLARRHRAGLIVSLNVVPGFEDDGFRLQVSDVGSSKGWKNELDASSGATIVELAATTRLGRQYAIYELARRLGARFYHPEAEWAPRLPAAQVRARAKTPTALGPGPDYRPDFRHRSWSFHGAHPLEHLEAFSDSRHPIDEAERVNRWVVKNRGDIGRGAGRGVAPEDARAQRAAELRELGELLGFRRSAGITLHNVQQGGSPDLDPTSDVPIADQIDAFVESIAERGDDPYVFGVHFGPTELTTTPDRETVAWIDLVGAAVAEHLPGVPVEINDHITGSQPTEHYDDLGCPPGTNDRGTIDYYDLAFHTDPSLGVKVHTVMFYPLEGPAPVYGQVSFAHKLCLIERAAEDERPITWFPEGSYWLSFDNAVPVYLPLYIGTRGRDIELLRPHLASRGGHVFDHRMFDSGHEWGYWQQDYAVGLWGWDADLTQDAVLGELADPLCPLDAWPASCPARDATIQVMRDVIAEQWSSFLTKSDFRGRPGGLYWYFAGEDPADELGAASGLQFRPVRLAFRDALALSDGDAAALEGDLAELARMDAAYAGWVATLVALRADVPAAARPWLDEVVDGLETNALRARHTRALYRVALALRAGDDHAAPLGEATAALAAAGEVIARREAGYRYPLPQVIGRGPNGTTYPFRVHAKTHERAYWVNRQQQIEDLVAGRDAAPETVVLRPVLADPGVAVALVWPPLDGLAGALDMGDGRSVQVGAAAHDYPAEPGAWTVAGALETAGAPLSVRGTIVRSTARGVTGPGGFTLVEPDSEVAQTVLGAIVPTIRVAIVADRVALLTEPGGRDTAPFSAVVTAPAAIDDGEAVSEVFAFELPIPDPSTGRVAASVSVTGARLEVPVGGTGTAFLDGALEVSDLVDALVALAGFDEAGATETLAGVLAFDPGAPPETVPFRAALELGPDVAP
ncbi:MAG: hypothetical protein IT385_13990 [Deltaproteobacteria bacterium]|nr:hypothetical protein [Deltaproteobacteria bacterium]